MKDIFVNFKKTGIISVCFLSSLLSGYSQRIVVSPIIPGGGSSGSLTGSYTFTSPISEAAGVVSLPLAIANLNTNQAVTNASTRDFYQSGGNLYSKNLSLNHRWVYYDDFNQPMTTPGVFPDSPTGHKYNVFTGGGGNTNKINLVDGKWWLGETGAVYQSVTFGTNGVYGSAAPINTWGGTFSYQRSTNSTPDGYEQNLFLILSPQVDFLPTNYLHITVGANIFRVQRELSATNIIYAQHFGGRYLAFDTNHSFTVTIISNNIICDIAGMRYVGYDESLSTTYGNIKVATWEAIGSPTNQFWAKWDSQYAGYADNEAHWQYAGPFAVRSNGVLSRVTSTNFTLSVDDAYASGWNGSLDVPSKNAIYDKIETLGSGGSGGTNFPAVLLLVGNTNLTLQAGKETKFLQITNGNHGVDADLAVPESGHMFTIIVSNSHTAAITNTFYTNGVAASYYDPLDKTNATSWITSIGGMSVSEFTYLGSGKWIRIEKAAEATRLIAGTGLIEDTGGVNGLDRTYSTRRYTNYASANITINASTDVTANYTNAVGANNTITLATPVIGTSGSLGLVSDGSARTLAILSPVAITWLSTNDTATATNILTTASKRSLFAWRVGMGTDGISTNIHCWVKNQTP